MTHDVSILCISPTIYELHWPDEIDSGILDDLLKVREMVAEKWPDDLLNLTNTYNVLGIYFKNMPSKTSFKGEIFTVLDERESVKRLKAHKWTIPVCYEPDLAPDLNTYLKKKGLNREEFIQIHSGRDYLHYFNGFLPGFPYLGGMDDRLYIPRKSIPDRTIGKGSVAIGGKQTGIYPNDSPGGWYVVGKTPVEIFSPKKGALLFKPGDWIHFDPIGEKAFIEIKNTKDYRIRKRLVNG
jgi:KipI family sensor histidine kinase inhibitor